MNRFDILVDLIKNVDILWYNSLEKLVDVPES